jgi:hypothetical protein
MPTADGSLTAEESRALDALVIEARAWIEEAAKRTSPEAAASAAMIAGFNAYEDTQGTAALADMIEGLSETAQQKLADGPPIDLKH